MPVIIALPYTGYACDLVFLYQVLLNCTLQSNVSQYLLQISFSINQKSSDNFLVTKRFCKIAIKHEKTTIRALDTIGQSMFQPIYENLRNA